MNIIDRIFGRKPVQVVQPVRHSVIKAAQSAAIAREKSEIIAMGAGIGLGDSWIADIFNGEKFAGGFGATKSYWHDYWTLRARSEQLFHDNVYARGLIRRLVTNEINTGLTLEAIPNGRILGITDEVLNDWSDITEDRFQIWANNKQLCDYKGESTFSALHSLKRTQAIISGDVLITVIFNEKLNIPQVHLIDGGKVVSPFEDVKLPAGHTIKHGVQLDADGRQYAYWVTEKGKPRQILAYGQKSGRRVAWLDYGCDRLIDDVRGMPLFALIMQSLKELDRYRDSELRAAVVNSMIAAWVKKDADKPGTRPFTGGGIRKDFISADDSSSDGTTQTRNFAISAQIPGAVIDELQTGESPQSFDTSRPNVNFGAFENAIANALAWANELPPEVYLLSFQSNYSASRAAINEFKMYLNKRRHIEAENFCDPIYQQWLMAEVLAGRISAPGLIEAWRDPMQYDIFGAWVDTDWGGAIKPSVDLAKEVRGYAEMNAQGWITNDRASKELTGTKFSKNMQRLKKENQLKAELTAAALRPMIELEQEFGSDAVESAMARMGKNGSGDVSAEDFASNVVDLMQHYQEK